jgi:hypothetical protein
MTEAFTRVSTNDHQRHLKVVLDDGTAHQLEIMPTGISQTSKEIPSNE